MPKCIVLTNDVCYSTKKNCLFNFFLHLQKTAVYNVIHFARQINISMERRTNKLESKERLSSRRILLVDFVGSHYSVLRVCAGHRTTAGHDTRRASWTAKLNRPRGDVKVMARVKLTTFATFPEA